MSNFRQNQRDLHHPQYHLQIPRDDPANSITASKKTPTTSPITMAPSYNSSKTDSYMFRDEPACKCFVCAAYWKTSPYRRVLTILNEFNDESNDESNDALDFHMVAADFHEHICQTATEYQKKTVPPHQVDNVNPTSPRYLGGTRWNRPGSMEDQLVRIMRDSIRSTVMAGASETGYRGSTEKIAERLSKDVIALFDKRWEAEIVKWKAKKEERARNNNKSNDGGSGNGPRRRRSRTLSLGNSHVPKDEEPNFDMFR